MNLAFVVPVLLAASLPLISIFAPFTYPPPFEHVSIVKNPKASIPAKLEGPLEPNEILHNAQTLFKGQVSSPDTVKFDDKGDMYIFTRDGIFKAEKKGSGFGQPKLVAEVKDGHTTAGDFDSEGNIYFCDAIFGLCRLTNGTKLEVTLDEKAINACNCLVVSSDDVVYIADTTHVRFPSKDMALQAVKVAITCGHDTGRLLKFTPSTKKLEVLVDNLAFPAGIELSRDESYVLFSESGSVFRIRRYWLKGPKAGTIDTFVPSLPGFGDGIGRAGNSTYWLAMPRTADATVSFFMSSRLGRYIFTLIPDDLANKLAKNHTLVAEIDANGKFLRSFHDTDAESLATSVTQHDGKLYVGGNVDSIKVVDLQKV